MAKAKPTDRDAILREHLLELLRGDAAHLTFDAAVAKLPPKLRGANAPNQPHTPWHLVEHIRIAQRDILEFSRNPHYEETPWPEGYWPKEDAPKSDAAWKKSLAAYHADLKAMQTLIADPAKDLLKPFPHGKGQTLAREAILLVDHTAYHLGQLITLRRALNAW
jgi:hypothetical protein